MLESYRHFQLSPFVQLSGKLYTKICRCWPCRYIIWNIWRSSEWQRLLVYTTEWGATHSAWPLLQNGALRLSSSCYSVWKWKEETQTQLLLRSLSITFMFCLRITASPPIRIRSRARLSILFKLFQFMSSKTCMVERSSIPLWSWSNLFLCIFLHFPHCAYTQ